MHMAKNAWFLWRVRSDSRTCVTYTSTRNELGECVTVALALARHDNLVDGDEDQLHEKAQATDGQEADRRQPGDLQKLGLVRLLALLDQPARRGWNIQRESQCERTRAPAGYPQRRPPTVVVSLCLIRLAGRTSICPFPWPVWSSTPPVLLSCATYLTLFLTNSLSVTSSISLKRLCASGANLGDPEERRNRRQ